MIAVAQRKWIARFIQVALIAFAVAFTVNFFSHRRSRSTRNIQVQRDVPAAEALAPGDLRIYSVDSAVDVVLAGDKLLTGLSPKIVDKVRREMESKGNKDTSSLGGMIAGIVQSTVSSSIGTHVVYPLRDIREVRYDDGNLILIERSGSENKLFAQTKVDRNRNPTFDAADAQRLIEAVRARKAKLEIP